ncbi:hypothetical protein [Halosimplex amylolyticum]|uniref:hypothetical protein n=1 Tax=Halosimplex amylolyticum TaxID=3396616 RepID=UPI003F571ADA
MSVNFGHPASWALGLGVLGGAIAGTVVPAATPAEELRHVLGFILLFGPTTYVLIDRYGRYWESKHPYLRFVVFTLSLVVATVVLVQIAVLLPLGDGTLAQAVEFLAAVGGFVVTAWATFFGGAERLWAGFLERTDTEW